MKKVEGEVLLTTIKAYRKTRGQTPFELAVGYVTNSYGQPTGEIRLRTEQIESGVAPVVGTLRLEDAIELSRGLDRAIKMIRNHEMSPRFADE